MINDAKVVKKRISLDYPQLFLTFAFQFKLT